jgi:FkbM family methyltransferase
VTRSSSFATLFARLYGAGLALIARLLTLPFGTKIGARAAAHASSVLAPIVTVRTPRGPLRFWCPTAASATRATNFNKKEPETRQWIDAYVRPGDHVWDVGANIGSYTLYPCLTKDVTVTAFEPMAANFAVLAKNIALSGFSDRVTPLCLALSDQNRLASFYLADTEAGRALHALDAAENVRGAFRVAGRQSVAAAKGDDLVKIFGVRAPDHIKIDVDGHELRVLEGMAAILPTARTVWIEMRSIADVSGENKRISEWLERLGHRLEPLAAGQAGKDRLFVNRRKIAAF